MTTAAESEASIINALKISDPTLDTALGTPVRKIASAVAMEIAKLSTDEVTTTTLYNIDALSGTELDYFVGQFGFTRQQARAARGYVTITRDNADTVEQIGFGSQFSKPSTATSVQVTFTTNSYAQLSKGVLKVEVPVTCVTTGSIGNVPAETITRSSRTGYIKVTNPTPTYGGRDAETDEGLRKRFLATVFRNVSGTRDQAIGLAMAHEDVTNAILMTQASRYSETVTVVTEDGAPVARVDATFFTKFIRSLLDPTRRYWVRNPETGYQFERGEFDVMSKGQYVTFHSRPANDVKGPIKPGDTFSLSHKNVSDVTVYVNVKNDKIDEAGNYSVNYGAGTITVDSASEAFKDGITVYVTYRYDPVVAGDPVTIDFDYVSIINRDDSRAVELYVDGSDPKQVSDVCYLDVSKTIKDAENSQWRRADGTLPINGHVYVPLSRQPLYSGSGTINVGTAIVLREGVHFKYLYDESTQGASTRGADCVEMMGSNVNGTFTFDANVNAGTSDKDPGISGSRTLKDDTPMNVPYYYDAVPETVQGLEDAQTPVTMDLLVHAMKRRRIGIYLTVMYSTYPREQIRSAIEAAVVKWAKNLQPGGMVQISDIETVAANVAGVDNVRLATKADANGLRAGDENGDQYSSSPELGGIFTVEAYGVIQFERDGQTLNADASVAQRTSDFPLDPNEVLDVSFVRVYPRTQSNWG